MSRYANVGGVSREITHIYANVGGVSKEIQTKGANVGGVYKEVFSSGQPIVNLPIGAQIKDDSGAIFVVADKNYATNVSPQSANTVTLVCIDGLISQTSYNSTTPTRYETSTFKTVLTSQYNNLTTNLRSKCISTTFKVYDDGVTYTYSEYYQPLTNWLRNLMPKLALFNISGTRYFMGLMHWFADTGWDSDDSETTVDFFYASDQGTYDVSRTEFYANVPYANVCITLPNTTKVSDQPVNGYYILK